MRTIRTVKQEAEYRGLDASNVLRRIQAGRLPATRLPDGNWIVGETWDEVWDIERALNREIESAPVVIPA
jgi:hypothetical protein